MPQLLRAVPDKSEGVQGGSGTREWSFRLRHLELHVKQFAGSDADSAPQSDPWRRLGWGRFAIGGAGIWLDFFPRNLVLAVEWRPVGSSDGYDWDMSKNVEFQSWSRDEGAA